MTEQFLPGNPAALCIQGSLSLDDAPWKIAGKVRVISSDLSLETIE